MLAQAQSQMVGRWLQAIEPGLDVRFVWVESEGDRLNQMPLADSGGKGLFVRAVEKVLQRGEADLAVHSLKDLPADPAETGSQGLTVVAIPQREDARDCLITREGFSSLTQLPQGAVLGTAGPRRAAQALKLRPDLRIELIRGNVETRLRKVMESAAAPNGVRYDATLMAVAGLNRAGLSEQAVHVLEPDVLLPAAGQGALALQCRADDHVTLRRALPLNHVETAMTVHLERSIVAALEGDCHSCIAAYAQQVWREGEKKPAIRVRARVLTPDGSRCAQADITAGGKESRKLLPQVLQQLREHGAQDILKSA